MKFVLLTVLNLTESAAVQYVGRSRLLKVDVSWILGRLHRSLLWIAGMHSCSTFIPYGSHAQMIDTTCKQPYGEVEGFSVLLGYASFDAGGCKVQDRVITDSVSPFVV